MAKDFEMKWQDVTVLRAYSRVWTEWRRGDGNAAKSQAAEVARWLIASLLILNSGGALAVFNEAEHLSRSSWPAALFVLGILMALLNGLLLRWSSIQFWHSNEYAARYWTTVSIGEKQVESDERRMWDMGKKAQLTDSLAPWAGWASTLLFAGGVIAVACGYLSA
jgi:hypothetical protein